jgi:hypothetical protein
MNSVEDDDIRDGAAGRLVSRLAEHYNEGWHSSLR